MLHFTLYHSQQDHQQNGPTDQRLHCVHDDIHWYGGSLHSILFLSDSLSVSGLKCYNCGYRIVDGGEPQSMPDLDYCNDFATPEDIVADCTAPGDCCASMKEEIDRRGLSSGVEMLDRLF